MIHQVALVWGAAVHVVEVAIVGDVGIDGRRNSSADGGRANRSCAGRGVAAVIVISRSSHAAVCVPMISAAERPSLVSDAWRNAARFDRAAAGRWMLRCNSLQHIGMVAGDEFDPRHLTRLRAVRP